MELFEIGLSKSLETLIQLFKIKKIEKKEHNYRTHRSLNHI